MARATMQPTAVTPIGFDDVAGALAAHLRKEGRAEFRRAIREYLSASAVATYTSFVRAVYRSLRVVSEFDDADGEAVLLPRYSCPDFAHAIDAAGLERRYCDLDPQTLTIDPDAIREADTDDVLALIAVNHFGLANPMDEVVDACDDAGVALVEDLGYSLGATYEGRRLGRFGDVSVLNFREGKAIPVPGGMVTTRRDGVELDVPGRPAARPAVEMACGYRTFSHPRLYYLFHAASTVTGGPIHRRVSMEDTTRGSESEFDHDFDPEEPLARMANFDAALGHRAFDRLEHAREVRNANAERYADALASVAGVQPIRPLPGVRPHFIRYPVLVDPDLRNALLDRLADVGIEASTVYHDNGMRVDPDRFPGSHRVCQGLLTLPTHPNLRDRDLQRAIEVLETAADGGRG